ncbi:MAG: 3-methyl-2-oxobutanoate hydroxymethyltransferase [Nitrososphaerales archaeon]
MESSIVKKVTTLSLLKMKEEKKKIVMITAYDYPTGLLADKAGVDVVLVGDSLGMVVLGYENTLPVTMDEMLTFCKAVSRGVKRAFIVADMPFMSYQVSKEEAIRNAGRLIKEGGADGVKLEGGIEIKDTVEAIVQAGIPVMGHIGFTPQSVHKLGGYKAQGRSCDEALKIIRDAQALVDAGVFSIVLEFMMSEVAELITRKVKVPTIGIGAGQYCDGQVLVIHDALGLYDRVTPRFVKQYVKLSEIILDALQKYSNEVRSGIFPEDKHTFHMSEEEYKKLLEALGDDR